MGTVKKADRTVLQKLAKKTLQRFLDDKEISRKILSRRLNDMGWHEPERSISNKIMRGTFSFQYVLLCMIALGEKEISFPLPQQTTELVAELKREGARQRQRRKSYPAKQYRRQKKDAGKAKVPDE